MTKPVARFTPEQRQFIKSKVAHYLDNKDGKSHTARDMADWARIAWWSEHKFNLPGKIAPSLIVTLINELRDDGYLIVRDPGNKGYKCAAGKRNGTPDVLALLESLQHEKGRIATSIENQVVKPTVSIQNTVITNVPLDQAVRLVGELRNTVTLEEAVGKLKQAGTTEYRLIPMKASA